MKKNVIAPRMSGARKYTAGEWEKLYEEKYRAFLKILDRQQPQDVWEAAATEFFDVVDAMISMSRSGSHDTIGKKNIGV